MLCAKYVLFFVAILGSTGAAVTCGKNEHIVQCGQPISCQPSCTDPNQVPCATFACTRGCDCNDGFIRATANADDNPCIEKDQCGSGDNSTGRAHEVESDCAHPCQPFCTEPDRQPCPTFTCSKGYICADGYIRTTDDASSPCISNVQCPQAKATKNQSRSY